MSDALDQMRKAQEDRFFKLEQEKHLMAYVVRRWFTLQPLTNAPLRHIFSLPLKLLVFIFFFSSWPISLGSLFRSPQRRVFPLFLLPDQLRDAN